MSKLTITFIITTLLAIYVFTQSNNIDGEVDELVQDGHIFEDQDLDQLDDVVGSITPEESDDLCFDEENQEELNCNQLISNIRNKIETHSPRKIELIIQYRNQIVEIKKSKNLKLKDKELLSIEELSAIELEQVRTRYFINLDSDQRSLLVEKHGGVEYLQYFYATNMLPPEKGNNNVAPEAAQGDFDEGYNEGDYQDANSYADYDDMPTGRGFDNIPQEQFEEPIEDMIPEDTYRDVASDIEQTQDNEFIQEVESDFVEEEFVQENYQEQEMDMSQDYQQEDYYE